MKCVEWKNDCGCQDSVIQCVECRNDFDCQDSVLSAKKIVAVKFVC